MSYITNAVFICIFFNTGFLVMLCNANTQSQGIAFFNGQDTDFNTRWLTSQGETIVGSMVFNIWFPFAMELGYQCMRMTFRLKDYLLAPKGHKTSVTSIQ